jgi:hypothetical protein
MHRSNRSWLLWPQKYVVNNVEATKKEGTPKGCSNKYKNKEGTRISVNQHGVVCVKS